MSEISTNSNRDVFEQSLPFFFFYIVWSDQPFSNYVKLRGTALMQLVEVHKEIHAQQTNILKAFYVDLLLPLESNLEKDTKVVAGEHKKGSSSNTNPTTIPTRKHSPCARSRRKEQGAVFLRLERMSK
ncbi:brain-specific angiogenesis inhibitor 1-associated protein 2 [Caerostris extrusa]|uniref:Brain-specific angiogenesis inhibitor 1-associated protein 2 n=1 Tax=Caerostris extrusa TaxID=172846 RepID=A0AAV4T4L8_CAEEX|nr:brain-specific angiogenesis inhibitor 1-associated protein 2 [Caerostris extrusa]